MVVVMPVVVVNLVEKEAMVVPVPVPVIVAMSVVMGDPS